MSPSEKSFVVNLDEYFRRTGYDGPRTADADVLRSIHRCHARTIPFENLDVLRGVGIRIDLESVFRKLVLSRRGGYCFEQNSLLASVLRKIGFEVTPLIARVRWNFPMEMETPLTHMLLRVETEDGPRIADVGFGSLTLLEPIAWELDVVQQAAMEPRRLVHRGRSIVHQAQIEDVWRDVYSFSPDPAPSVDFELGNWFTSTHCQSRFVNNLVVARSEDGRRHAILNRELVTRHSSGSTERRTIAGAEELLEVLRDFFGLDFPAGTRFGTRQDVPWPI